MASVQISVEWIWSCERDLLFYFFCTALDKLLSVHLLGKPRVMDTSLLLESSELVLPLNQIAPAKGQFPHQTNQICLHTGFTLLCTIESETEGRKVPGHRRSGQSPSVKKYLVPQSQQIPDLFKNHVWHLSEDRSQNASSSAFQLGMLSNAKAASKSGNSTRTTSWITSCYFLFLAIQLPGSWIWEVQPRLCCRRCFHAWMQMFHNSFSVHSWNILNLQIVMCTALRVHASCHQRSESDYAQWANQSSYITNLWVHRAKLLKASRIGCPVRSEFWAEEQACQSRPGIPELITVSR